MATRHESRSGVGQSRLTFLTVAAVWAGVFGASAVWAQAPCPPLEAWQQTYGSDNYEETRAIAPSPDGGFLLGGITFSESGEVHESLFGGNDYCVIRLDPRGEVLWSKVFGGNDTDTMTAIEPVAGGGWLLGGFSRSAANGNKTSPRQGPAGTYDWWVLRLDADGNKIWEQSYGGLDSDRLHAMKQVEDGGFLLVGESRSAQGGNKTVPSFGMNDGWVVRIDADGSNVWQQSFGTTESEELRAIAATPDGGFLLGGNQTPGDHGANDFLLLKLDAQGNEEWNRTLGGSDHDGLRTVHPTADGGFWVVGSSFSQPSGVKTSAPYGGGDYWVVRTDASGTPIWDRSYGGVDTDNLYDAQVTSIGGLILAGTSYSGISGSKSAPPHGADDYWAVTIDGDGQELWQLGLGGLASDLLTSVAAQEDGFFMLAGTSYSSPRDNKTAPLLGSADFWLVRIFIPPDEDCDGDGVMDAMDACLGSPVGMLVDGQGCSVEQACPCAGGWESPIQYVTCVSNWTERLLDAGTISEEERQQILDQANRAANGCLVAQLCPCEGGWADHTNYVACVTETTASLVAAGIMTEAEQRQLNEQALLANCPFRPQTVLAFGLLHEAVGDSLLQPSGSADGALEITEVGPDGTDGVSVLLQASESSLFLYPYASIWGDYNESWYMDGTVYGRMEDEEDVLLATVRGTKPGYETYPVAFDFSPMAPESLTFQVYRRGELVAEATTLGSSGSVTVTTQPSLNPRVNPLWREPDGTLGALIEFTADPYPEGDFGIHGPFEWGTTGCTEEGCEDDLLTGTHGDRIFVRLNHPARRPEHVSRTDVVVAGGIRNFTFLDERLPKFGRLHRALGTMQYEIQQQSLGLRFVRPIESTDETFGVTVEPRGTESIDFLLEPVRLTNDQASMELLSLPTIPEGSYSGVALRFESVSNELAVTFSFEPQAPDMARVRAYLGGQLEDTVTWSNGLHQATLVGAAEAPPAIVALGAVTGSTHEDMERSIRFTLAEPATLRDGEGRELFGDHFEVNPIGGMGWAGVVKAGLMVSLVPRLTILGETSGSQPPNLSIARQGNQVALSWPVHNYAHRLESAPSVEGPFEAVEDGYRYEAGRYHLTRPVSPLSSEYYRLRLSSE